jgi:hypothetical protein
MPRGKESVFVILAAGSLWPTALFAEESAKATGYSGADYIWFTVIGLILVYGAYDTFFKTP